MENFLKSVGVVVVAVAISVLLGILFGWFVMLLWNWLIPPIFGLTTITYWQGFGLWILCDLLFKANRTTTNNLKD